MYAFPFKANYSTARTSAFVRAGKPTSGSRELSYSTSDNPRLDVSKVICPRCGAEKWEKCFRTNSAPHLYRRYQEKFHAERVAFAQSWAGDSYPIITPVEKGQVFTYKVTEDEYLTTTADGFHSWPVVTSTSKEQAQERHLKALITLMRG